MTDHRLSDNWHGLERLQTGEMLEEIHEALLRQSVNLALTDLEKHLTEEEAPGDKKKKK